VIEATSTSPTLFVPAGRAFVIEETVMVPETGTGVTLFVEEEEFKQKVQKLLSVENILGKK